MQAESENSYLNVQQFDFLHKKIEHAHKRLKEQQLVIDSMETKMISHLKQRDTKWAEM